MCRFQIQLVLGGARQGDIYRDAPGLLASQIGQAAFTGIVFYPAITLVLDLCQMGQLFGGETCLIDQRTAGVRDGDHPCIQFQRLFNGVLRHVT
ncbi:hypothetical protein D3C81_1755970 [compost metagenome]